jgi:hypothetical protein
MIREATLIGVKIEEKSAVVKIKCPQFSSQK